MKKISLAEFDELLYTATFLKYYWAVFTGMNTSKNIDYIHAVFIRDFIDNCRLNEFSNLKVTPFNKVIISENQLDYLKKCAKITQELKEVIWAES